jgi:hypothetical protein
VRGVCVCVRACVRAWWVCLHAGRGWVGRWWGAAGWVDRGWGRGGETRRGRRAAMSSRAAGRRPRLAPARRPGRARAQSRAAWRQRAATRLRERYVAGDLGARPEQLGDAALHRAAAEAEAAEGVTRVAVRQAAAGAAAVVRRAVAAQRLWAGSGRGRGGRRGRVGRARGGSARGRGGRTVPGARGSLDRHSGREALGRRPPIAGGHAGEPGRERRRRPRGRVRATRPPPAPHPSGPSPRRAETPRPRRGPGAPEWRRTPGAGPCTGRERGRAVWARARARRQPLGVCEAAAAATTTEAAARRQGGRAAAPRRPPPQAGRARFARRPARRLGGPQPVRLRRAPLDLGRQPAAVRLDVRRQAQLRGRARAPRDVAADERRRLAGGAGRRGEARGERVHRGGDGGRL